MDENGLPITGAGINYSSVIVDFLIKFTSILITFSIKGRSYESKRTCHLF